MKMQIAFRETSTVRMGHNVVISGGVVEFPSTDLEDYEEKQLALNFIFDKRSSAPMVVVPAEKPRPVIGKEAYWLEDQMASCDIDALLLQDMHWAVPNEVHNGDIFLRLTDLPPSEAGARVFAFTGFLHLDRDQDFDFKSLLQFESWGRSAGQSVPLGRVVREGFPQVNMTEMMRGMAMSSLLKQPIWGFGEERYALPGAMRLDRYKELSTYYKMFFNEQRTPEQDKQFKEVEQKLQGFGLATLSRSADEQFVEFARRLNSSAPDRNTHIPRTAKQLAEDDMMATNVIKELLQEQEAAWSP